jgi:hypothetical protein
MHWHSRHPEPVEEAEAGAAAATIPDVPLHHTWGACREASAFQAPWRNSHATPAPLPSVHHAAPPMMMRPPWPPSLPHGDCADGTLLGHRNELQPVSLGLENANVYVPHGMLSGICDEWLARHRLTDEERAAQAHASHMEPSPHVLVVVLVQLR